MLTANFETGVNGNSVSTSDAGNATPWDQVTIGASGVCAYDTTRAALGSLSCKVQTVAAAVFCRWQASFGTQTDHYGRVYVYLTAVPASTIQLIRAANVSFIDLSSTGFIAVNDNVGGATQGAVSYVLNQWIRVEYHFLHNTSTGVVEAKLFNRPYDTVPSETVTRSAVNTGANANFIEYGNVNATAGGPFWMDAIIGQASAYPGPIPTLTIPDLLGR